MRYLKVERNNITEFYNLERISLLHFENGVIDFYPVFNAEHVFVKATDTEVVDEDEIIDLVMHEKAKMIGLEE